MYICQSPWEKYPHVSHRVWISKPWRFDWKLIGNVRDEIFQGGGKKGLLLQEENRLEFDRYVLIKEERNMGHSEILVGSQRKWRTIVIPGRAVANNRDVISFASIPSPTAPRVLNYVKVSTRNNRRREIIGEERARIGASGRINIGSSRFA